jgi:hydrogenase expression/formation protein HypE
MTHDKILLDHGSGGKLSHRLTAETLLPVFRNPVLERLDDGAVLDLEGRRLAFSTDTYVVDPIFFPGGSIGDLAVNGTVNDLSMCGADPRWLSVGMILEEGLAMDDLRRVAADMGEAARRAGVIVVTGDTKVVPRGAADRIFINTSGIGVLASGVDVGCHRAQPGDRVLISGTLADHGVTVLTQREGLQFESPVRSDTAPLNHLVKKMLAACPDIHVLRDPTRGGVGTALGEIAQSSEVAVEIRETDLPVRDAVAGLCELLGFDPLYVANEGKLLAFVPPERAPAVLAVMREDPAGSESCEIGEVQPGPAGKVFMRTRIGGRRIVDMLTGEQLPRIC